MLSLTCEEPERNEMSQFKFSKAEKNIYSANSNIQIGTNGEDTHSLNYKNTDTTNEISGQIGRQEIIKHLKLREYFIVI